MKLVGITGSIGCGKTTIANIVREQGYGVFDVDAWVRRIYYNKEFLKKLGEVFPDVIKNGVVDKRKLRNIVFDDNKKLKKLEQLIHPSLKKYLKNVIHKQAKRDDVIFIDLALLYEMGWDRYCDIIIVAHVDYEVQKQRVMNRDKISSEDFDKINNVQICKKQKKQLADVVVDTNKNYNLLRLEVIDLIKGIEIG